jgi:hypothetical protein
MWRTRRCNRRHSTGPILLLWLGFAVALPQQGQTRENSANPSFGGLVMSPAFEGEWWLATSSGERRGFLAGYLDCYVDDQRHALNFAKSWVEYETLISRLYEVKANRSLKVGNAIVRFGQQDPRVLSQRRHDGFGEEWWRGDTANARRGFVEGYISCRSEDHTGPQWLETVTFYTKTLDDIYNVDDHNGLDAPEYGGSIAEALVEYRTKRDFTDFPKK